LFFISVFLEFELKIKFDLGIFFSQKKTQQKTIFSDESLSPMVAVKRANLGEFK
jgi:hypothetical protein